MAKEGRLNSNQRITNIIFRMIDEEKINLRDAALDYEVSERTIQRDMSVIKNYLSDKLKNDPDDNHYMFHHDTTTEDYYLTTNGIVPFPEILAIMKVLIGTRTFSKDTLNEISYDLVMAVGTDQRKSVDKVMTTIKSGYDPVATSEDLVERIINFNNWIEDKMVINFMYTNSAKNPGQKKMRTGVPLSLYFADHYFYVVMYMYRVGQEKDGKSFVYRLDRFFGQPEVVGKMKFEIPREKMENEGDIRAKSYKMNSGEMVGYEFIYYGNPDIAKDQLPGCKIKKNADETATITGQLSYYGAKMWAVSQGVNVRVKAPINLVEDVKADLEKALKRY